MFDSEKAELLTTYIQKTHPEWTYNQSLDIILAARGFVEYSGAVTTENDSTINIKIIGDTIVVDGKDITGNLGSQIYQTTYGDNSPALVNSIFSNDTTASTINNTPTTSSEESAPFLSQFTTPITVTVLGGVILIILEPWIVRIWPRKK